jgi:pimeloyl-ACP methyl ester carboxylesterase
VIAHDWGGAVAWSLTAQHPELMQNFVVLNAPHTILFAKALASDTGQQAAGAYMNVLRLPGSESLLAKDGHAWLRDLLGELSDEELQAYRGCWAHGLAGGCNYYRASPLHPDTPDAPGRMAAVAALLDPADFQVKVRTQVIWGTGDVALRPVLLEGLEQHVSDLRVHRIEGAGHWVTRRNAVEVNRVIRSFLADTPG